MPLPVTVGSFEVGSEAEVVVKVEIVLQAGVVDNLGEVQFMQSLGGHRWQDVGELEAFPCLIALARDELGQPGYALGVLSECPSIVDLIDRGSTEGVAGLAVCDA